MSTNTFTHIAGVFREHLPGFLKGKDDVALGRVYTGAQVRVRSKRGLEIAHDFIHLGQK